MDICLPQYEKKTSLVNQIKWDYFFRTGLSDVHAMSK